jgi:hypothetical protein
MANRLKMAEHQAILGLVRLNRSYRRIAAELGIDRETVSRHVKAAVEAEAGSNTGAGPPEANATISITGSSSPDPELKSSPEGGIDVAAGSNATISITGSQPPQGGADAAISIAGSPGKQSDSEPWRATILSGLERGLSAKRICRITGKFACSRFSLPATRGLAARE